MRIPFPLYILGQLIAYPFRPKPKEQSYSEDLAKWGDDMTYELLDEDNKDVKKAIKIAKKYAGFEKYAPQYRLGNLYIIKAYTPPPQYTLDADTESKIVGVILGNKSRFIKFPNHDLFEHFMNLTRINPTIIKKYNHTFDNNPNKSIQFTCNLRTRMAILLATGETNLLEEIDFNDSIFELTGITPELPTWKDVNNNLTIQCFALNQKSWSCEITRHIITVDAFQKFTCETTDLESLLD